MKSQDKHSNLNSSASHHPYESNGEGHSRRGETQKTHEKGPAADYFTLSLGLSGSQSKIHQDQEKRFREGVTTYSNGSHSHAKAEELKRGDYQTQGLPRNPFRRGLKGNAPSNVRRSREILPQDSPERRTHSKYYTGASRDDGVKRDHGAAGRGMIDDTTTFDNIQMMDETNVMAETTTNFIAKKNEHTLVNEESFKQDLNDFLRDDVTIEDELYGKFNRSQTQKFKNEQPFGKHMDPGAMSSSRPLASMYSMKDSLNNSQYDSGRSKKSIKRSHSITNKNGVLTIEDLKKEKKKCWEKFKFHPNSSFKIKWDLFIILLSLYNAIVVPYEFAFDQSENIIQSLRYIDYIIDVCFAFDIVVNFRTIYFDPKTEAPVLDGKKIAWNYILKGRFLIDLLASVPIDELSVLIDESNRANNQNLKFLGMFKLVRILRLGRMITYLKMNQSFKFGVKFLQLILMLLLILHWIGCLWFYIISVNYIWVPPNEKDLTTVNLYDEETSDALIYCTMFYYAVLTLVGNDLLPRTYLEVGFAALIILIGSIVIGIIIGEFSSILSDISQKARQQTEELDMISQVMTGLKIPEHIQNRVIEFYDLKNECKFIQNDLFYTIINDSLGKTIKLFQTEEAIRKIGLFDSNNVSQIEHFASIIQMQTFLPGDVIVKQGDIGDYFYLIISGLAEVSSEKADYLFFDTEQASKFIGDSKTWIERYRNRDEKQRNIFAKITTNSRKSNNPTAQVARRGGIVAKKQSADLMNYFFKIEPTEEPLTENLKFSGAAKSTTKDHSAHEQSHRYTTINELNVGDYFGEVAVVTHLRRTCSVYAVSTVSCGMVERAAFLELIKTNADFKNKLMHRMNKYNDSFLKFLVIMLRNVGALRTAPQFIIKNLMYKLKERKFYARKTILTVGELSDTCYFVIKGKVGVYVPVGDHLETYNYESHSSSQQPRLKLFCTLNEGSHFNFSHFLLEKESVFMFRADTEVTLMCLERADYYKLAQRSEILQSISNSMKALYDEDGNKYDFSRMMFKSMADFVKAKRKKLFLESQGTLGGGGGGLRSILTRNIEAMDESPAARKRDKILKMRMIESRNKFWKLIVSLKKRHFHISEMQVFSYIDLINMRRVRKESERKMDRATKILQENIHQLQLMDNLGQYTMTAKYFMKNPLAKEVNQYMTKKDKEAKNAVTRQHRQGFCLAKGSFEEPAIPAEKPLNRRKSFMAPKETSPQKVGVEGPIVGIGFKQSVLTQSVDLEGKRANPSKVKEKQQYSAEQYVTLGKQQQVQNEERGDEGEDLRVGEEEDTNNQKQCDITQQKHRRDDQPTTLPSKIAKTSMPKLDEDHANLLHLERLTVQAHHNANLINLISEKIKQTADIYEERLLQLENAQKQELDSVRSKQNHQTEDLSSKMITTLYPSDMQPSEEFKTIQDAKRGGKGYQDFKYIL